MVKKVTCPICGSSVRKTNLRRHMLKSHPGRTGGEAGEAPFLHRYWMHLLFLCIVVVGVVVPAYMLELGRETVTTAVFETDLGTFEVELDTERAPITAGNFINLTNQGFYDGLTFHRVAKNFVIQGGDPMGTGAGGSGVNLPWEDTGLKNEKYTLAMARAGDPNDPNYKDSGSSQFFINLKDNPDLDNYKYPFVVFARVTKGFEVVDAIGSLYPPELDGPPTQEVKMTRVTIRK